MDSKFQCQQCTKSYSARKGLYAHVRAEHQGERFSCDTCGKEWKSKSNLKQHEQRCSIADRYYDCPSCNKRCFTMRGLQQHQHQHKHTERNTISKSVIGQRSKNHKSKTTQGKNTSEVVPALYHCRRCSYTTNDRRLLYHHGMRTHYQRGGALQPVPWNVAPWVNGDGTEENKLKEVYETNMPIILEEHREGPISSTYNFPVDNSIDIRRLISYAREIYQTQQHAFRINLAFGVILQHRESEEYRYYTPYHNNQVLESPLFISKRTDLQRLYNRLRRLDILDQLLRERPDTKWIPILITNIVFYVTSTSYPIGNGTLPTYLVNKDSLHALVKNRRDGKPYTDNLCAFRCLALHRGHDIKCIDGPTKQYCRQWCQFKNIQQFCGLEYTDFPDFEKFFKINMEVYSLEENKCCISVYKSRGHQNSTMYVNLHQNHMSYIIDFKAFAKKFQCQLCDRHFDRVYNLKQHQKVCTNKTKYEYPGRFYQPYETIFDKLDQFGIHVDAKDCFYEYFACYDFESVLHRVNHGSSKHLQWTAEHQPISVSICSNVDGYTQPLCIVETDQEKLVQAMATAMSEIAEKAKEIAETKWGWVLDEIKNKIEKDKICDINEDESEDEKEEKEKTEKITPLQRLQGQFKHYMSQLPVLGFNSANYDLNLIKKHLARQLNLHEAKNTFVVKKNNSYTCISSEELKFMDISQFLAAGSSYASFLKAYGVEEQKGYFPYEWFDDVSKLAYPELPPHNAFYSSLRNNNITEEEYKYCQQVWRDNNMQTFKDFLVWYNNLDVGPFVTAVEHLQKFYFDKRIDVFKTAISVPGIARQLLFRTAQESNASFALCDKNNSDLYQTIKNNIVGGPSIIFHRHHAAGKTKIRGGKTCGAICGYDANALYLACLGAPMPVGAFIRRRAPDFKPEVRDQYMAAYYWMDYLIEKQGSNISHLLNHGKEVRIGNYPVDGFDAATNTVYQFHGCYFHGHTCAVTRNIKDENWLKNRDQKYKKTKEITEYLKRQGCKVIEMWECQFKELCKQQPDINTFINQHRPDFYQRHKGKVTMDQILQGVYDGTLFGMVEVDIEVSREWPSYFKHETLTPYEYFAEMSPLFCTTEIPFEAIGKHMQEHVEQNNLSKASRRLLVGGLRARQILIATPLLRWYLQHGLVVTKVYQVIEFKQQRCFENFVTQVSEARRLGDTHPDKAIIGETSKNTGNSAFGSMIMDKTKHREINYIEGENETCLKVNDPRFRKLECLDEETQYYEVEMAKKKIKLDLPIQLGYFVLQYGKLRMLEFYYDFMDTYVDRSDFQYCEMDTDSAYLAISGSCLDEVIKPTMKTKYEQGLKGFCTDQSIEADNNLHWFPRTCCQKHAKYDKRTPGLFKLEYQGSEMIGLCSKTYIVRKSFVKKPSNTRITAQRALCKALKTKKVKRLQVKRTNEYKFSSKGVSKRNIRAPMSTFRQVLKTGKPRSGVNRGFRVKNNTIFTYIQERKGFSYYYCKRKVLADGVSTEPLDITMCPVPLEKEVDQLSNILNKTLKV